METYAINIQIKITMGYAIVSKNRQDRHGGGVAIYVRNEINLHKVTSDSIFGNC